MHRPSRTKRGLANRWPGISCLLTLGGLSASAFAVEPRLRNEPYLMSEPAEVTQVVDAFDEGDPFDLNLSLGYQYTHQAATILREGTAASSAESLEVARYKESTHRLNTRADLGLYHDIALVVRMPIILSNDRTLDSTGVPADASGTASIGYDGGRPLFQLPFRSPNRSGVEYLALGLDFGILNQYRDPSKPSWLLGFEARFDVSSPMNACNANPAAGELSCADPGDVNRNGQYDATLVDSTNSFRLESSTPQGRKAGVSRGTTGLDLHTFVSKRIKYIEPYGGLRLLVEFPKSNSGFKQVDFESSLVNFPPLEGSIIAGLAVIPWEDRSAHQRTTLDLRLTSTYRSEGRDYSELFDALGSSNAASLRAPAWSGYRADPADPRVSVIDPNSRRVYFNGLTDVQQHLKNRFSAEFTWQAARFVKMSVGLGYTAVQSHYITYDQACNANFTDRRDQSGPCRKDNTAEAASTPFNVTGIPNPNYRQPINVVGRRYMVSDANLVDVWLNATVMF